MTSSGVILYGPPASGKDTVTRELVKRGGYAHFERLKVGPGRTLGYRITTAEKLAAMEAEGDILYTNSRYGASYAIDRTGLSALVQAEQTPVVHMGQVAGITALLQGFPMNWLVVGLWCNRIEAAKRLDGRADALISERLAIWDETLIDMRSGFPELFTLIMDTLKFPPDVTAAAIADTTSTSDRA